MMNEKKDGIGFFGFSFIHHSSFRIHHFVVPHCLSVSENDRLRPPVANQRTLREFDISLAYGVSRPEFKPFLSMEAASDERGGWDSHQPI
jgi:hypothetical protein